MNIARLPLQKMGSLSLFPSPMSTFGWISMSKLTWSIRKGPVATARILLLLEVLMARVTNGGVEMLGKWTRKVYMKFQTWEHIADMIMDFIQKFLPATSILISLYPQRHTRLTRCFPSHSCPLPRLIYEYTRCSMKFKTAFQGDQECRNEMPLR